MFITTEIISGSNPGRVLFQPLGNLQFLQFICQLNNCQKINLIKKICRQNREFIKYVTRQKAMCTL